MNVWERWDLVPLDWRQLRRIFSSTIVVAGLASAILCVFLWVVSVIFPQSIEIGFDLAEYLSIFGVILIYLFWILAAALVHESTHVLLSKFLFKTPWRLYVSYYRCLCRFRLWIPKAFAIRTQFSFEKSRLFRFLNVFVPLITTTIFLLPLFRELSLIAAAIGSLADIKSLIIDPPQNNKTITEVVIEALEKMLSQNNK